MCIYIKPLSSSRPGTVRRLYMCTIPAAADTAGSSARNPGNGPSQDGLFF